MISKLFWRSCWLAVFIGIVFVSVREPLLSLAAIAIVVGATVTEFFFGDSFERLIEGTPVQRFLEKAEKAEYLVSALSLLSIGLYTLVSGWSSDHALSVVVGLMSIIGALFGFRWWISRRKNKADFFCRRQ